MRSLVFLALWAWIVSANVSAQSARRSFHEPGLLVETGARTGACDALTFTANGQFLLAAGDDKAVRAWKFTEKGLARPDAPLADVLRWSVYREQRGAIYALALSPDSANRHVALGGFGIREGALAVLDRETGEVVHALKGGAGEGQGQVTWSLAFSPSGKQLAAGKDDGGVWLWDLARRDRPMRKLGRHPGAVEKNPIRFVAFLGASEVLSVGQDGLALGWDATRPGAEPVRLAQFQVGPVFRAALGPDRKWLAAAGQQRKNNLEVRRLGGNAVKSIELSERGPAPQPRVRSEGRTTRRRDTDRPTDAAFFKETGDKVTLYDLTQDPPRPSPGPKPTFHAEALAYHPGGRHLAVAGGNDHEVTLWDLRRLTQGPLSTIRSPGSCLWGVGISADGRHLGYREQREPDPPSPNRRGKGGWSRVFDLQTRTWASVRDFQPLPPDETCNGWSVEPSKDAYVWHVRGPGGEHYRLPLDRGRDDMPRCYAFLKPSGGRGVRVAVGHYWGVSIFELDRGKPEHPVRMLVGHQGYVTSLAATAKQDVLVTASRDQTVAAWSLADWPAAKVAKAGSEFSPELGARFSARLGELRVEEVTPGSPAWEAGLSEGDDVVLFAHGGSEVKGGPEKWLERLRHAAPGRECYFRVKRPGRSEPVEMLTTVRQRPLWRFFPTRDGEWVLWRWRDYYYACSTNGDAYVGWQVSGDVDVKPRFHEAAELRGHFHRPAKVAEAIQKMHFIPDRANIPDLEPPELQIETDIREVKDRDVTVTLTVTPRGRLDFHRAERLTLWIGDHRFWPPADAQPNPDAFRDTFRQRVVIPRARLRSGFNRLTFQCTSRSGASTHVQQTIVKEGPRGKPRLFLVLAGVIDYSTVKPLAGTGRSPFANLPGVGVDLERLKDAWSEHKDKLFQDIEVTELREKDVTPEMLHDRLRGIARRSGPDDLLVLCLNGHGYSQGIEDDDPKRFREGTFTFVCPNFDFKNPKATGITSELLYENLTAIPCRKLVLLNACFSGNLTSNPLRSLAPDRVGPIIVSASDFHESAFTMREGGLPYALAEALEEKFAAADRDPKDGVLDTLELARFVRGRVPVLLADLKREAKDSFDPKDLTKMQTPVFFPDEKAMERFPLGKK